MKRAFFTSLYLILLAAPLLAAEPRLRSEEAGRLQRFAEYVRGHERYQSVLKVGLLTQRQFQVFDNYFEGGTYLGLLVGPTNCPGASRPELHFFIGPDGVIKQGGSYWLFSHPATGEELAVFRQELDYWLRYAGRHGIR